MKKILRNLTDEAGKIYWASVEKSAEGVREWPDWKKAGVTAEQPGMPAAAIDHPEKAPKTS